MKTSKLNLLLTCLGVCCFFNAVQGMDGDKPTDDLTQSLMFYGAAQDKSEEVKLFRMLAEQGNANAQLQLGMRYYRGEGITQDQPEAVKWLKMAAEQKLAEAQFNLGMCYYRGKGIDQNQPEAVKWLKMAADQGYADAVNFLGTVAEQDDKNAEGAPTTNEDGTKQESSYCRVS